MWISRAVHMAALRNVNNQGVVNPGSSLPFMVIGLSFMMCVCLSVCTLSMQCVLLGIFLVPIRAILLTLVLMVTWPVSLIITINHPLKGAVEPMTGWRR